MTITDDDRQAPVEDSAKRRNTWPMPAQHNRQAMAKDTGIRQLNGKGHTQSARPFKATGHKGGISRQGSKRG